MKSVKILLFCTLGSFFFCNYALAWPLTGILQEWSFEDLRPHDIAFTEDGTLWLVHDLYPEGTVFSFDPLTGSVGTQITASEAAHFQKIAQAPDGKMWITDRDQHRLYYFDPNVEPEDITLEKVDLPENCGPDPNPWGVAVAPNGNVWFTCQGVTGNIEDPADPENPRWPNSVGYYNPTEQDWTIYPIAVDHWCDDGVQKGGTPMDIVVSPAGYVFFSIDDLIWGVTPGGRPGIGYVEANESWGYVVTCPESFDPIKLDKPLGVALDSVDPDGSMWFIDQGYIHDDNPDEAMVGQIVQFIYQPASPDSFERIAFPTPPEFPHWDAHFLAVDPGHQYVWATSFNHNALLIIERSTSRFSSLHFDYIEGPMGIRLFEGEVWFTATGGMNPEATGVGRFTVLPDTDDDGIPDEMDTDPDQPSIRFDDGHMAGQIIDRGDQELAFIRHISHDGRVGLIVMADRSGMGGMPARISPYENCPEAPDPTIVEVEGNRSALFTCSTPRLKALLGPVVVTMPGGVVVTVPTMASISFSQITEESLNIQNSGTEGIVSIEYQDELTELNVGESTLVEVDVDKDGVLGSNDQCPGTSDGDTVNVDGCSIDQLCPCEKDPPWKNKGKYVSCVAKTAENFLEDGLISGVEKDMIVSEAAKSDCGK